MTTGFTIFKTQQRKSETLVKDLFAAFKNGGGTQWFKTIYETDTAGPVTQHDLLLESYKVDAFGETNADQKYYMLFRATRVIGPPINYTALDVYFGSADQITWKGSGDPIVSTSAIKFTVWGPGNYPTETREYNYRVTFTDRGFAWSQWTIGTVNKSVGNLVLAVQRPVNPSDGTPKTDGEAPIFALLRSPSATATDNSLSFSCIRRNSDPVPTPWSSLNKPSAKNLYRVTMDWTHPNLFDNFSHTIKFPFGLATSDALYLEEMDLISLVNSTSFAGGQDVQITMYGEAKPRKYFTTWGDVQYGIPATGSDKAVPKVVSGARIGILMCGGGLPDCPTPPAP